MWKRATVVGCGLIGASFALALKRAGTCERIAGWDVCADALDEARRRTIIDEVDQSFARGEVSSSDLIYLAMPVGEIIRFLREHGQLVRRGALVTDAGSTKAEICRAARAHLPKGRLFIGGHPVAGSHLRGLERARADLFVGACYVLVCESPETAEVERAFSSLSALIEQMGARLQILTADEHDRVFAYTSHLPQLLASALATTVEDHPAAERLFDLIGPGYRDMTRLAASSWTIWQDILSTNALNITAALDDVIAILDAVRRELRADDRNALRQTERLFHRRIDLSG
ncbi:MAG: prephenate dehydrogenase/arogenate dehydrogenase family protein [Pyrinomonas sp.]|uniref:prephenate dehydrogenase n=1 Tax=Pyrinomonas sp. TaxID=2080306 RepID=UPI0033235F32